MLKKLELAQNITKRTKVKKDCKIQDLNHLNLTYQTNVLTITPRKLIERKSKFILISLNSLNGVIPLPPLNQHVDLTEELRENSKIIFF